MAANNQITIDEVKTTAANNMLVKCNGANLEPLTASAVAALVAPHLPPTATPVYALQTTATMDSVLSLTSSDTKIVVTGGYKEANLPAHGSLPHGFKVIIANFASGSNGSGGVLKVKAASGAEIHFNGTEINMSNGDVEEFELAKTLAGIGPQWVRSA